jgi:hypothetical protein
LVFVEPGPSFRSTLYLDGSVREIETEIVWRPILDVAPEDMTLEEFKRIVLSARDSPEEDAPKIKVGGSSKNGLDIVFNADGSVPLGALTALDIVSTYIEGVFSDSVTVSVDVKFADLGGSVLGSTGVDYIITHPSWTTTLNSLIDDRDSDDNIQNWLPNGGTITVRYDGGSSEVTYENRCCFAKANYGAVIGSISERSARITFNDQVTWDYEPRNGVSGYCFQSVVVHEVGHALGFVSRAEDWYQPNFDILALDIFRFQHSDGEENYNPDTYEDFQITPRLVDYNNPDEDHSSDIISAAYRMSDGSPYQASHFRQGLVYAIMQPAISPGATFYPDFYKTPDLNMLDAIGWDYSATPNSPPSLINLSPEDSATDVEMETLLIWTGGDPDPGDIVTYDVHFEADNPTPELVSQSQSDTFYDPGILEYGRTYYWRIVAWDSHEASTPGPVWSFETLAFACGDCNADGRVTFADALYLKNYYYQTPPGSPAPIGDGDVNVDGRVTFADALYLKNYYYQTPPGAPPPCEPGLSE